MNQLQTTLKAATLIGLVENGVIQREANGDIDTCAFERFWTWYERQLTTALHDQVSMALADQKALYEERNRLRQTLDDGT